MSATLVLDPIERSPAAAQGLRFGRVEGADSGSGASSVQWRLKRNCSISPRQSLVCFAVLCAVSLGIGSMFWWRGAPLVMPFAGLELLVVASLLLLYARHAADFEEIRLSADRLVVEHASGRHVERVEFALGWVRVEPAHVDRSLVELSGQGRRIRIGRFVRPELRRQLADELRWALRRWHGAAPPAPNRTDDETRTPLES